jgi:hypothetical protein
MVRRFAAVLVLAGWASLGPGLRGAADPGSSGQGKPSLPVEVNAFGAASFSLNSNHPPSGLNGYRAFDFADRKLKLDVVEVVLQKRNPERGEWGFRLDVEAGGSIPRVEAASGLFRNSETGKAGDFDLQQAYLSYVFPLGSGLRLDAGKFVTPMGFEVIPGYDGFNDCATQSFLFAYAIPFTHTGFRLGYALSGRLSGQVLLVQGWDNVKDNNSAKTVGAGLTWTPGDNLSLAFNGMIGPEQKDNDRNERLVGDLVATWKPLERLSLGANIDYGYEASALGPGVDAVWRGAAFYATLALSKRFSLSLRAEVFEDRDGARTGLAQSLSEVTLTPQFKPAKGIVIRADFRLDASNRRAFEGRTGFLGRQPTVFLNALFFY